MATALDGGYALRSAFARADREQNELQRLKASGERWACLDFHPERLARDNDAAETENRS